MSAGHLRALWIVVGLIGAIATAGGLQSWQIIQSEKTPDDVYAQGGDIKRQLQKIEDRLRPQNVRPDPFTGSEAADLRREISDRLIEIEADIEELKVAIRRMQGYLFDHSQQHQIEERERFSPP